MNLRSADVSACTCPAVIQLPSRLVIKQGMENSPCLVGKPFRSEVEPLGVNGKASLEGPTVCLGAEEMYASLSYVQGYININMNIDINMNMNMNMNMNIDTNK